MVVVGLTLTLGGEGEEEGLPATNKLRCLFRNMVNCHFFLSFIFTRNEFNQIILL